MRPILITLHLLGRDLPIHSYGVALALGFTVAVLAAHWLARRAGEPADTVAEVWIGLVLASLVGARLLFVVTNPSRYLSSCRDALATRSAQQIVLGCTQAFRLWQGDLVFYGGSIGCLAFLLLYARRRQLRLPRLLDLLMPAAALGHAIGRLGCLAAGCCYGHATDGSWGIRFGRDSLAYQQLVASGKLSPVEPLTPPLHPVQLYEALGELTLFLLLSRLLTHRRYHGQVFVAWLGGYGLLRFVLELLRGDDERRFLFALSTSQLIALAAIVCAIAIEIAQKRRRSVNDTISADVSLSK